MAEEKYIPRLKTKYNDEVKQLMQDKFQYENVMMIPKFEKIVVNMGVGEARHRFQGYRRRCPRPARHHRPAAHGHPRPQVHCLLQAARWHAHRRQGHPARRPHVGVLHRLTSVAIPRIRDFRGISAKSFDGRGNFSMGVTEQLIFPEVDFDSVDHTRGMDITIVTTAKTDEEAKALLGAYQVLSWRV